MTCAKLFPLFLIATSLWADTAADLASAVMTADSDQIRNEAILNILRALQIGVYSSQKGNVLLQGAERSDSDLYFYDDEVGLLAAAVTDPNTSYSLSDVKRTLERIAPTAELDTITEADFDQTVLKALATLGSGSPGAGSGSLAGQLIREIGLLLPQPYDLFANPSPAPESIQLNALQITLFVLDFYGYFKNSEASLPLQPDPSAGLQATQRARIRSLPLTRLSAVHPRDDAPNYNPCVALQQAIADSGITLKDLGGPSALIFLGLKTFFPAAADFVAMVSKYSGLAEAAVLEVHGALMSFAVRLSAPSGFSFYYRTSDDDAPVQVPVHIEMAWKFPDWVVSCGFLSGLTWPGTGGLPGIPVQFDTSDLAQHTDQIWTGPIPPDSNAPDSANQCIRLCKTTTDETGTAVLTFSPKLDGIGNITHRDGTIDLHTQVLSGLGNWLMGLEEKLPGFGFPLKFTAIYHKGQLDGTVRMKMTGVLPETLVALGTGATRQSSATYSLTYNLTPLERLSSGGGFEIWKVRAAIDYEANESWTDYGQVTLDCGGGSGLAVNDVQRDIAVTGGMKGDDLLFLAVSSDGFRVIPGTASSLVNVSEFVAGYSIDPCAKTSNFVPPSPFVSYPAFVDFMQPLQSLGDQMFPLTSTSPAWINAGPWGGIYLGADNTTLSVSSDLQFNQ